MERLPEEIELDILGWIGHEINTNYYMLRQVCKKWKCLIETNILLEIDHERYISIPEFLENQKQIYIRLLQKRNNSVSWDDHRGFLVVTEYDAKEWNYYENLRQYLFFEKRHGRDIIFPGKMIFYDL